MASPITILTSLRAFDGAHRYELPTTGVGARGCRGSQAMMTVWLAVALWLLIAPNALASTTILELRSGVERSGSATQEWIRAVEEHEGSSLKWTPRPLTADEIAWRDTIRARLGDWERRIQGLMLPFEGLRSIGKIQIVLGNQNGEDAFGIGGETIYFDLSALSRLYGPVAASGKRERLDRIFAHEYTHVLQTRWEATHAFRVTTPFGRALRQLWREGLGNMYSLSDEWVTSSGDPTPMAQEALEELEPIFVDRLRRLRAASESEEGELRQGLSSGPFAKKRRNCHCRGPRPSVEDLGSHRRAPIVDAA